MSPTAPSANTAPSGVRPRISLDGLWDFAFDGRAAKLEGSGHTVHVPGIWQTQFPALRNSQGTGRYARRVDLPPEWRGKRIHLVMEGVFHRTAILIDGQKIAGHSNGWTRIDVDLTPSVAGKASFELGILATVPDDSGLGVDGFNQTLTGKQDWYGTHGGIWKPAWIEAREDGHIGQLAVGTLSGRQGDRLTVKGSVTAAAGASLRVTVSRNGAVAAKQEFPLASPEFDLVLPVAKAERWSPDHPVLYEATAELIVSGKTADALTRTVGFRHFEARDGRLYLNGAPFYMFGALDQDWYPEEDCRHPDPRFLEQRFRNAKAMGLNCLRCHVKIPDQLYLDLADRLGLVVWLDMPYAEMLSPASRDALRETFERSASDHGHHPSICIWTLFNEGWGIEQDDNPDDRRWLLQTFDWAKALVPASLVVDNSPCFPRNYHLKTDIEDFHWYNGFPHQNDQFAKLTADFANRAAWAWSPHGDAIKTGREPLICSEFGVWGLPHPRDIAEKDGSEPWWFESGHDWNDGCAYPHGLETRFRDARLAPIFGSLDGFIDAAQEAQFRALKNQIEILRWQDAISGYVITELNDVQWESNGLMDVRNTPRRFSGRLAKLQEPWLVLARTARTAIGPGEAVEVEVRLAGLADMPAGAVVAWRFGGQAGSLPASAQSQTLRLTGWLTSAPLLQNLELTANDGEGRVLSQNVLEFCLAPPPKGVDVSIWPADAGADAILERLGWAGRAASAETSGLVLATQSTSAVRERLLGGSPVLLIANTLDALTDPARTLPRADLHNYPQMQIRAREGSPWDGRWMGAFTWRRTDGPWAAFPGRPMLDEHWCGLLPEHVLTGFRSACFGGLVDAGVAVGWLHKAAAFTKRTFLGQAWLTAATFDLTSAAAGTNPLAPHLLGALVRSAVPDAGERAKVKSEA